jgi:hypothetical protein
MILAVKLGLIFSFRHQAHKCTPPLKTAARECAMGFPEGGASRVDRRSPRAVLTWRCVTFVPGVETSDGKARFDCSTPGLMSLRLLQATSLCVGWVKALTFGSNRPRYVQQFASGSAACHLLGLAGCDEMVIERLIPNPT